MTDSELLRTTVVGSYPQPDWLIDKPMLRGRNVPRVRIESLWRMPREVREEAIRDAALLAIRDMERAGIDVITDGEVGRQSYSSHFVTALDGIDDTRPAILKSKGGHPIEVPLVVGPIRYRHAVELEAARYLRGHTRRRAKVTLPGPFTLAQQAKDEHYHDVEALAMDFAAAINQEARALEETGIDVIQLDEPWLRNDPDGARRFGLKVLNRALEGLRVRKAIHVCFGYAFLHKGKKSSSYDFLAELSDSVADEISIEAAQPRLDLGVLSEFSSKYIALGVLDHSTPEAEPVEVIAERIRAALKYLPPGRLLPAPDCGMKYMTRGMAFVRLENLARAAERVRAELASSPGGARAAPAGNPAAGAAGAGPAGTAAVDAMQRLADRFFSAIENADVAALDSIYTPDAVVWHNYDKVAQSRDDNIAMLAQFPSMFRTFRYADIRRAFFPGGFVQQHVCRGVKADGNSFDVPNCMVITVRGDQIARVDDYFDSSQDARPEQYR